MDITAMGIGLVVVVIITMLVLSARYNSTPPDYDDEETVLGELEIYTAYGRAKHAIEFLEKAVEARPENEVYHKKLTELRGRA